MTEYDSFEKELAAYRPQDPSAELKQRIANARQAAVPAQVPYQPRGWSTSWRAWRSRTSWRVGTALAGGLLASLVTLLVLWQGATPKHQPLARDMPERDMPEPVPEWSAPDLENPRQPVALEWDNRLPTVWAYHLAVDHSTESLNDLLDQHTTVSLEFNPERARMDVFAHWKSEPNSLLGEL